MNFSKVAKCKVVGVGPVVHRSFNRGNGRRLPTDPVRLALIPMRASTAGVATHEVEMVKGWAAPTVVESSEEIWDASLPSPTGGTVTRYVGGALVSSPQMGARVVRPITRGLLADEGFVCHFGAVEPVKRWPGSKVLFFGGVTYFFLTWSDLFGAAIKECELGFSRGGNWVRFLREAGVVVGELKSLGYL